MVKKIFITSIKEMVAHFNLEGFKVFEQVFCISLQSRGNINSDLLADQLLAGCGEIWLAIFCSEHKVLI